ncbi:MAG: hypothetical protein PHX51_08360 [Clostridia bacterium]|nr:hypothetical protein [Clostridia bacterium]
MKLELYVYKSGEVELFEAGTSESLFKGDVNNDDDMMYLADFLRNKQRECVK